MGTEKATQDFRHEAVEVLKVARFGEKSPGAKSQGFRPVCWQDRVRKDDDGHLFQVWLAGKPTEKVVAIHPWHFEIENEKVWNRVFRTAVGKKTHCLLHILGAHESQTEAGLVKRAAQEKGVVVAVVNEQNSWDCAHNSMPSKKATFVPETWMAFNQKSLCETKNHP